jgi:tetratricopeptide (TPR) repeat protein
MDYAQLAKTSLLAGNIDHAVAMSERAVQCHPRDPATLLLAAEARIRAGQREVASQLARRALDAQANPEGLLRAATAVYEFGLGEVAEASFRRALRRQTTDDNLRFRYAVFLLVTGQPQRALTIVDELAARDPQAEVHALRGLVLRRLGQLEPAILAYQSALRHDPLRSEWWCHVGDLRLDQRRLSDAIRAYRNALEAVSQQADPPKDRLAYPMVRLADAFARSNMMDEAWSFSEKAIDLAPGDARAAFNDLHLLPILHQDESSVRRTRARYEDRLEGLLRRLPLRTQAERSAAISSIKLPFYLHYLGGDVRPIMQRFGALVHHLLALWQPDLVAPIPMPPVEGKIRVGFASYMLKKHTVTKLFGGWIRGLDPSRFAVYLYNLGPEVDDTTRSLQGSAQSYAHLPGMESAALCRRIRQDDLHVLIFPELGMATSTYVLAGLRSAPIQAVAWGHPVTTGLPNVDLFLSSAAMEPPEGQTHYTERLVRLPGVSVLPTHPIPPNPRTRAAFGLSEEDVVLLVPQSLFKLLPSDDQRFAQIAALVPRSRLVFLRHTSDTVTAVFKSRISEALRAHGLKPEAHLTLLPPLEWADYLALNRVADVFLDAPSWSGGMTTWEALCMDLVPVTCRGTVMRARHTAGILDTMGLGELVATDADAYVQLATRVATDGAYRASLTLKVREHRDAAFHDRRVLPALERTLEAAVAEASYQRNPREMSGAM